MLCVNLYHLSSILITYLSHSFLRLVKRSSNFHAKLRCCVLANAICLLPIFILPYFLPAFYHFTSFLSFFFLYLLQMRTKSHHFDRSCFQYVFLFSICFQKLHVSNTMKKNSPHGNSVVFSS